MFNSFLCRHRKLVNFPRCVFSWGSGGGGVPHKHFCPTSQCKGWIQEHARTSSDFWISSKCKKWEKAKNLLLSRSKFSLLGFILELFSPVLFCWPAKSPSQNSLPNLMGLKRKDTCPGERVNDQRPSPQQIAPAAEGNAKRYLCQLSGTIVTLHQNRNMETRAREYETAVIVLVLCNNRNGSGFRLGGAMWQEKRSIVHEKKSDVLGVRLFMDSTQCQIYLLRMDKAFFSSFCFLPFTSLSLKKARSSIGADRDSGSTTCALPPMESATPLPEWCTPPTDVPPPPACCGVWRWWQRSTLAFGAKSPVGLSLCKAENIPPEKCLDLTLIRCQN